jgi:hypothetical protein
MLPNNENSESNKVLLITTMALIEGEGNPGFVIAIIKKLLDALRSKAKACRRDLLVPFQTTHNVDNMDSPAHSLDRECPKSP